MTTHSRLLLQPLQQGAVSQKDNALGAAGTNPAVPNDPVPPTKEQRSPGCGDPAASAHRPPAEAAALLPGTRVRNKRTCELATVVAPRPNTVVSKGEIAVEYDDDPDTQWSTQ